jgi:peptide chain release factor 1
MLLAAIHCKAQRLPWLNRLMMATLTSMINSGLEKKLEVIDARCHALRGLLSESLPSMGSRLIQETHQELKRIAPISDNYRRLVSIKKELQGVQSLVVETQEAADAELHRMAREEEAELKEKLKSAEDDLLSSLLPSAQDHDRGAIVEIRPGTGGDEASLFAADLSHLYLRYAEYRGWQCEVMETSTNDQGGFKLGSFAFSGPGAYVRLKHEGGTHRVQRVPRTEKEGRLHTSTATVVVLPEADEVELEIKEEDVRVEAHRSSGAGGQSVNVTNSAIRLVHVPSGLIVTCQDERSQQQNRVKAMRVLRARLFEMDRQRKESALAAERLEQRGSGGRNERIRTYNFSQDRMTEHRLGTTLHGLESLMAGEIDSLEKLDAVIDCLTVQEKAEQLKNINDSF